MNKLRGHHRTWAWTLPLAVLAASCSQPEGEPDERMVTEVLIEAPEGTGTAVKKVSEEECKTSCSLAKHPIPELTGRQFELALEAYAQAPVEQASEALETLLFYGPRTRALIAELGTEALPAAHRAFLTSELERDALVSLRLVDDSGVVHVAYGPTAVPFGQKQHLMPAGEGLQAMEFNGTVMRTGVNYLWSRY